MTISRRGFFQLIGAALLAKPALEALPEWETLDVTRVDIFDRYEYQWKFIPSAAQVRFLSTPYGHSPFWDYATAKMDHLKDSIRYQLNGDLFKDGVNPSGGSSYSSAAYDELEDDYDY